MTAGVVGVTLPSLETVSDYEYFHTNADVATISMPVLREVAGYLYIHENAQLTSASFPSLETVGQYLHVYDNYSLADLNLTNSLVVVTEDTSIVGNTALCVPALDWPNITGGNVNISGNINARGRCDLRAPGVIVGNICSPVVTMEEGVRFDGAMQMHHVLEEAVQARTQRAPGALSGFLDEDDDCGMATGRIEAPATRDPSDLLDPENI